MSECYYCHWGWPPDIKEIFDDAIAEIGCREPLLFGPAHIVWSDENFDLAQSCLDNFDHYSLPSNFSDEEYRIVRRSLELLRDIYQPALHAPPAEFQKDDEDDNPDRFIPVWVAP